METKGNKVQSLGMVVGADYNGMIEFKFQRGSIKTENYHHHHHHNNINVNTNISIKRGESGTVDYNEGVTRGGSSIPKSVALGEMAIVNGDVNDQKQYDAEASWEPDSSREITVQVRICCGLFNVENKSQPQKVDINNNANQIDDKRKIKHNFSFHGNPIPVENPPLVIQNKKPDIEVNQSISFNPNPFYQQTQPQYYQQQQQFYQQPQQHYYPQQPYQQGPPPPYPSPSIITGSTPAMVQSSISVVHTPFFVPPQEPFDFPEPVQQKKKTKTVFKTLIPTSAEINKQNGVTPYQFN